MALGFLHWAEMDPARLALSDDQCELDYATLRTRTLALAGRLRREGAAPGDIVGVACDRSVESIVSMLAVYCAGAAWLPLDLSHPPARLASMVRDARPRLIVAGPDMHGGALQALGLPVLESTVAGAPIDAVAAAADQPAYVIFTSGSTGQPKGAVLPRRALDDLVAWHVNHPRLGRPARVLQYVPLGFDPAVRDVFATLATGGTLMIAPETLRQDPFGLLEHLRRLRIERISLPYVSLFAMAQAHAEGGARPQALRDVTTGGEALVITPAIRQLFAAMPGAVLHNEYGPTEASVFVTSHSLAGDPAQWPDRPPLGQPRPTVRLHVVDEAMQPVPVGADGELLIAGACLADGYINRPIPSAGCFVHLEAAGAAPERVYRSGDRVRRAADGHLTFLGRTDDQVKIAGHRVELAEVEGVLATHAAVSQVAVVAPAGSAGRRLVAHVLLDDLAVSTESVQAELGRHLAERLPAFARPHRVVVRRTLPRTPNGKIDRRRLEAESTIAMAAVGTPGDEAVEVRIADLWAQLLGVPAVDVDANVFDLGADSLQVMIFVTRLRALAGATLAAQTVYDLPTPRQQARALGTVSAPDAPTPVAQNDPVMDLPLALPLSEAQMEKWFACQFGETASLAFNESSLLRLRGTLDRTALERALATVWQRHEALRFSVAGDGSSQRFEAGATLPLALLDYADGQAEERLREFCEQQAGRPFDLTAAPLVRFALVRLGEADHALHVIAHHLVMDGWSMALFVDELATSYNAYVADKEPALAQAGSFRRHLLDEQARRRDGAGAASLAYWKTLHEAPPAALRLPADRPAPAQPDYAAGTEQYDFDPALAVALRQAARGHGVSLYGLLLAGFGMLMARLSGQRDFAVAVPFAGLALSGNGVVMGDGVSALPVRLDIAHGAPLGQLVKQVHTALLDAAAHQDTTLTNILRALGLRASGGEAPLTGVTFNLLPRLPTRAFAGLAHELRECPRVALDWDLYFNLADSGETLTLDVHYATARYDSSTVRRWIGLYATLLSAMVDEGAADASVDDLELLGTDARREVLEAWNATASAYDREQALTALIEAQMRQTPGRIAAECEGERIDYAALERATRAVAQALGRRGIGRGEMVGVCVPRSLDMLVAVLGILRSGAAYVPLDPKFPDGRLRHMATHARLRHVLMTDPQQVPEVVAEGRELLAVARLRAERVDEAPLPAVRGDDLAYVLFTSGSTGEPKGVRILHRNLVNFLLSMCREPGFGADDVLCAVTTLSFDIAGLELYLPLIVGGRLVIATELLHREPATLFELIERTGCTVLQTTPSLLQLLQGLGQEHVVRRLRLFVGGEALPLTLARAMAGSCGEFWNLYGPTETTIWSTVARIDPDVATIPLGKPIANTRIYVLDASSRPVPAGVVGEIWIGGDGVSDGYLFRPELTAERFVADPFAGGDARMYRTGDLGSLREGVLYFHGRADNQIKIRGYRIEPGDIEAAAAAEPAVRECVAVARSFGGNDVRLVLYVVADAAPELVQHLIGRLRETLPDYMRPQHIERLDALPKTPNGKIDRKALPAPASMRSLHGEDDPAGSAAQPPLTDPRQAYLARVWRELVGIAAVRPSDNFFDVGGHSLLAVEFTARVHRETGVRLNLLHVATSTLASLATELPESWGDARSGTLSLGGKLRRLFNR
ncbi:non-ribosomal peptide synthetase [Frateuria sp. STR12]|uniref:non-ribosomal peptide synthetase n=1 Tax=Frateuria hangzhouensis TaxID=2995589 RepID=UPI002260842C|nr:non-ribosomal peptide synthetase [Frateuria sp. STR12]MCX7514605.1 amino acid adenylation domain-containing protein [Frateuria sp. STR12]